MSDSHSLEWSLRVLSREHELSQSYTVFFFLGEVPSPKDVRHWRRAPTFVGQHVSHTWTGPVPVEDDTEIESLVPLQRSLEYKCRLDSLDPERVVPFVQRNLRWRVQKEDGRFVSNDELTSFSAVILSMTDAQKRAGDMTEYPDCTTSLHGA